MPALRSVKARRRIRKPDERLRAHVELYTALDEMLDALTSLRFPTTRYQKDPVAFFREVIGVEPWSRQIEILEAIRDHPRVVVKAGRKVSKSHTIAGAALWFYCSFKDAQVVMTSTTTRQVKTILWREFKMMHARSGRCLACKIEDPDGFHIPRPCPHSALVDGALGELPHTGLKSHDFRTVHGYTAKQREAIQGISGRRLLFFIDESSGVPDEIHEAIEGNRAGGARVAHFGNPTRTKGEFYEAFHSKSKFYRTITVSSLESPNYIAGKTVIPGLAERGWVEEKREEWGEDSPLFKVHILGEFAKGEDGKIHTIAAIEAAKERWYETDPAGRLFIGLDPAGSGEGGDDTAFAPRRGFKSLAIYRHRSLTEDGILIHLLGYIGTLKLKNETPVVVVDGGGELGAKVKRKLRDHLHKNPDAFELIVIYPSGAPQRQPGVYNRLRDELAANLAAWFRDGGSIPEDAKLEAELHEPEWEELVSGKLRVTPKDKIRKELGRSPDSWDALQYSTWEPLSLKEDVPPSAQKNDVYESMPDGFDPYAAQSAWDPRRRRG